MSDLSKHVLIIDDTVTTLDVVTDILLDEKYCVSAISKIPTIEELVKYQPDLILLDLFIGGIMRGREFCKELRSLPQFNHIPIILFSVYELKKNEVEEVGADAYIRKPFDVYFFLETIRNQLEFIHLSSQ